MEIPDGWTQKTINDVLSKKTDSVDVQANDEYRQIGIRSHGKGIFYKEPVSGLSLGNKRIFWIHPDCFIVNIVFGWEQAVAVTSRDEVGMVASHRFPMYRPKNNGCDVEYIEYFFKTKYGKYLLELASPGGAGRNKTLGQKSFLEVPLVLPELKEQQKIVKILKTWDRAIAVAEAIIAKSEAQKKALMQQLLTGKRRLSGFEGEWREVILTDKAQITTGSSNREDSNLIGEYVFFDRSTDIRRSARFLFDMEAVIIGGEGQEFIPKYFDGKFDLHQRAYAVHSSPDFSVKFLYYVIHFKRHLLRRFAVGSTVASLRMGTFTKIPVPDIGIHEQKKITAILDSSSSEIRVLQARLQILKSEKAALMQQLLTGKRRVKLTEAAA